MTKNEHWDYYLSLLQPKLDQARSEELQWLANSAEANEPRDWHIAQRNYFSWKSRRETLRRRWNFHPNCWLLARQRAATRISGGATPPQTGCGSYTITEESMADEVQQVSDQPSQVAEPHSQEGEHVGQIPLSRKPLKMKAGHEEHPLSLPASGSSKSGLVRSGNAKLKP